MLSRSSNPPETWDPVVRAARAIASPIQRILAIEAASGLALLAATIAALVWANTATGSYESVFHTPVSIGIGSWTFERSLHFWINEGLMTIFFFVVGLEIRREIFEGELTSLRKAALPLAAAVGGMVVPAAIFAVLNWGKPTSAGWAIPMATDIAFAVGVLTLLGSRVPVALRVLLLGLAVIDDIGAIVVIAVFYGDGIAVSGLLFCAGGIALVLLMRAAGVRTPLLYVPAGTLAWAGLYHAGVHPTIAGVMLGMLAPVRPWFSASGFAELTQARLEDLPAQDRGELRTRLDQINQARREAISPVERLIHSLHPWVAFGVMPVFALANAGVVLAGAQLGGDSLWLFVGIVAGLAVGKPLGIFVMSSGATAFGIATRSQDIARSGLLLVGMVGGIGFTMSLFIAQLAFEPGALLDAAKLAVLVGSGVAILAGMLFGLATSKRRG